MRGSGSEGNEGEAESGIARANTRQRHSLLGTLPFSSSPLRTDITVRQQPKDASIVGILASCSLHSPLHQSIATPPPPIVYKQRPTPPKSVSSIERYIIIGLRWMNRVGVKGADPQQRLGLRKITHVPTKVRQVAVQRRSLNGNNINRPVTPCANA